MESLARRAGRVTPAGVHSNVRLERADTFMARGEGAWLVDEAGRRLVDHLLGQGPAFLGHAHPEVNRAVCSAAERGTLFGAQHRLEPEASERVLDALGWAERVRIGMTSTECVQAALRAARAGTGRRLVIRFAGHYHGWMDSVLQRPRGVALLPGQAPGATLDEVVLEWNDVAAVERAFDDADDDIAAVLSEPVMLNSGGILPVDGFLSDLQALCRRRGAAFILDETITGFRVARGGAAEALGLEPDLAVYGKALGGGWPVAALAGRAELMDQFAHGVVHAGTFNANVPACAAIVAALDIAARDDAYARVAAYGTRLQEALVRLGREAGVPLSVRGYPAAFFAVLERGEPPRCAGEIEPDAASGYARVADAIVAHGVWIARRGVWYSSTAHDDTTFAATLDRVGAALDDVTEAA